MRRLAFLIVLLFVHGSLQAVEVKSLRSWREAPRTRVVFDVSGAVDYRVFAMHEPERLVVDFVGAEPGPGLALPPHAGAMLTRLRHARRDDGGLRVVLDLARPAHFADMVLAPNAAYGHRVVIDLTATGAPPAAPAPPDDDLLALFATPPPSAARARRPGADAPRAAAPTPAAVAPAPAPVPVAATRPATPLRDAVVAIDAGHGGADVGAIGPSGVYEKDITLAVARELAALINRQPGMRAVMTREGDRYLKLRERMDRARAARADLFVSIHADAFRDRRVHGSSVYVLSRSGASSEAAKWLAAKENASDLIGGVTLEDKDHQLKSVLLDLSQSAALEDSFDLARHVLGALRAIGPVHRKDVQQAGFMVLKSPDIPSILVETAFISNPTEEKRLRSQAYRHKLAAAMLRGVVSYFEATPPPGTRLAQVRHHRVARGDTLSGIANRYAVSVSSLKMANNLSSEMVRAGEVLRIP
ncbi:MAG: N-acetylmuramoyl-L-alanine amidase [Gammaproteobacteria bacterium]